MNFDFTAFTEDTHQFIGKYYTRGVTKTTIEDGKILKIFGDNNSVLEIKDDGDEVLCAFFEHHWHEYKDDVNITESILNGVFDVLSGNWASYTLFSSEREYGGGIAYGSDDEITRRFSTMLKKATHIRLKRWGNPTVEYQRYKDKSSS